MDWNKIGALGTIGALLIAVATLCIDLSKNNFNPWSPVLIAAVGACLFYSVILWNRLQQVRRLPFLVLLSECDLVLGEYRKMAFDYPDKCRFPLAGSSVPDYGEIWEYHHVRLSTLKQQLFSFLFAARTVFEARGIKNYPGPFKADGTLMIVDLIAQLEALGTALKERAL